jgi:cytochrome c oxidase accessory protein FixG
MELKSEIHPIRESVTTLDNDGVHIKLHPADVSGIFTFWRKVIAFILITIYILLPWVEMNGKPVLFLDILHRRFHIFGLTYAAQDFWMAYFFVTGLGFTLFFLTALFGRLWCGWACPQTVFTEQVIRRIERWVEGDSIARKRLEKSPLNLNKILKKLIKYTLFGLISILIAHVFLSYFVSIPELYKWIRHSPLEHWNAFLFITVLSLILFFNFTWFREQLCLVICPYGRLQSALIDDDSIVIGYDEPRGNPPGPPKKEGFGDCVNCNRCVSVCPTGIDIRQGLQMECIGCANCVDACNLVMHKLGRAKGLIRYDSLNGLLGKPKRIIRPRILLYLVLLLLGAGVFLLSAIHLQGVHMNVVRMSGMPYYKTETGIRNQYMVRIINKSQSDKRFIFYVDSPYTVTTNGVDTEFTIGPMDEIVRPLVVSMSHDLYKDKFNLEIIAQQSNPEVTIARQVKFLGPRKESSTHE